MEIDESFAQTLAGSLILAAYFNWGLLGILIIQIYTYYLAFPKDRTFTKALVYTVLVLEVTQTAITSHDVFVALASHFGSSSALDGIHVHWLSIPVAGGLTGGIGQLFFAYRIWNMSSKGSRGGPVIIGILAAASICSALVASAAFFRARTFSGLLSNASGSLAAIGVWNGFGAICDITIALVMPYYLMRHGTGLNSTHVMIVNLIRLIIETGVLTAVFAILHLCLYFANHQIFVVPGLTISKIYANTMLVILNNRIKILDGRVPADQSQVEFERCLSGSFQSVKTNSKPRNTSRVIVSKDRLTFRLDHFDEPRGPLQLPPRLNTNIEVEEEKEIASGSNLSPDKTESPFQDQRQPSFDLEHAIETGKAL
ncbi:unnamed protein product [Cyclocybe aegerita]|uniref:DUF6534 domain-containing protein n=1 Tax=Cyclocybe aegerita TaxID=1973307 RepID=A0A8S0X639_CYCAE|nr:unnamed protein product [Cyclocybe aegerita]